MRFLIEHETELVFPEAVREHQGELRLAPRHDRSQHCGSCRIEIEPQAPLREHVDCFGNQVHRFSLLAPHGALHVRVRAEVETLLENPFGYEPLAPRDERAWLAERIREEPSLHDFVFHTSDTVPALGTTLSEVELPRFDPARNLVDNAQDAMAWMAERFAYEPGATGVHAPLARFVEQGRGVCQDFAHLLVAWVRAQGFAARYAMGYVDTGVIPEEDQDAQATHAWAEVLIPGAGWRGFDATASLVANDCYVRVAVGRDSRDAAPVRGTFKGGHGGEAPRVHVRVTREDAEEQQVQ